MTLTIPLLATVLLTNAADVASAVRRADVDFSFDLTGRLVYVHRNPASRTLSLEDASGCAMVLADRPTNDTDACSPGDIVRIRGNRVSNKIGRICARCSSVRTLAKGPPPAPIDTDIAEMRRGTYDNRIVRIRGTVRDVFMDEIDPGCIFCILDCPPERIYVTLQTSSVAVLNALKRLKELIGASVSVVGLCSLNDLGFRQLIGRMITIRDLQAITVCQRPPEDPFIVPSVNKLKFQDPRDIIAQGRHRLIGTVIAAWNGTHLLVRDDAGEVRRVELADAGLPSYGERIEAVGLPETDLYRINLSSAIYRRIGDGTPFFEPAQETPVAAIFTDETGHHQINPALHGRTIRIVGEICDLPSVVRPGTLTVKNGAFTVPVNLSNISPPLPPLGSRVEISGICVVETENWRSNSPFPHTTGITLIIRRPADIRILAYPPWWTPPRLIAVIGTLVVFLLGIIIWNFVLKRLVDRRSRQLFKEQIARTSSELRIDERTRLAVELHDSIAQNLTGISFEIDAADRLADTDLAKMRKHLNVAATSLRSCRGELRNCLWDLRHQTLEASDMETAIRQTLEPHVANVKLSVRFNVPRERISDSSTHAILRIIRELTLNAIRHGKATSIWVAGSIEAETLKFSVRDNGIGFDPANCPGDEQGHYGLLGIRERVNTFEGTLRIESEPGKGTKATICLNTIRETKT